MNRFTIPNSNHEIFKKTQDFKIPNSERGEQQPFITHQNNIYVSKYTLPFSSRDIRDFR
jgi:hypothetical protein